MLYNFVKLALANNVYLKQREDEYLTAWQYDESADWKQRKDNNIISVSSQTEFFFLI